MSAGQANYRARFARDCVNSVDDAEFETYRRWSRRLVVAFRQNGLAQTVTMLSAERHGGARTLLCHLHRWLTPDPEPDAIAERPPAPLTGGQEGLPALLLQADPADYLRAMDEAILLGDWLKKFAEVRHTDNLSQRER